MLYFLHLSSFGLRYCNENYLTTIYFYENAKFIRTCDSENMRVLMME